MTVTITIEDETATDLALALQSVLPPEVDPPVEEPSNPVDLTDIHDRLAALEGRKIWWKNTGDFSEKRTTLPVNSTKHVIYSVALPDLKAGDLIDVRATFEITNPYSFNVMVGRQLILGDGHLSVTGSEISEAATRNITPGMHHDHIQDFGTYLVPSDMTGKHITVVAWSGSSAANSTHNVILEQDYGRLEVKVFPSSMIGQ